jgi:chromosome segregation ATPase
MARGITQKDVDQAADALLLAGERPTVDRIRHHLGTGSPNTVTRLLDGWWKALGPRLTAQQRKAELPAAPDAVSALASQLWEQALEAARVRAEDALAADREILARDRAEALAVLEAAQTDAKAARHTADEARAALTQAVERGVDMQRLIDQQAGQLGDLARQRDDAIGKTRALEADLAGHRARLDQVLTDTETERQTQGAHLRAVEDRAHAEVDRARQEIKDLRRQLERARLERQQHEEIWRQREEVARQGLIEAQRDAAVARSRAETLASQLERLARVPAQRRPSRAKRSSVKN